jgi:hypothetical protein
MSWCKGLHGHDSESRGGTHRVAPEAAAELKRQAEDKFHMYCWFALMTYEAPGSIWVVRRMCDVHTNTVLRCFNKSEGLNYRVLVKVA